MMEGFKRYAIARKHTVTRRSYTREESRKSPTSIFVTLVRGCFQGEFSELGMDWKTTVSKVESLRGQLIYVGSLG